jgi:hypothetical protein
MGFTAVDVREDSLLFRLHGSDIRGEDREWLNREGHDWRGLPFALGVTDERGSGAAYCVGYGCAVA